MSVNTCADEETPLLSEHAKKTPTPLPVFQFSILLLLQLVEPLTSQVISPFTPQLIRDLGVTHGKESHVGYYVGLMHSLFFLTEAVTVLHWSRLSDRIGRKPVILMGVAGLSISMYCFGLSTTFWGLVLSRSLSGALNGNIGVLKSMTAELTDASNISRAYAFMPLAWSSGGTLGPMIGGFLARPAERFPKIFGESYFLQRHPYFLPCAVTASFAVAVWIFAFFFLKETVTKPTPISQYFGFRQAKVELLSENTAEVQDISVLNGKANEVGLGIEKPLPLRSILTPPVLISAANYATLSLADIAFRSIQPLFFSTPIHLGGLGLPPHTIGKLLGIFGVLNGIFQVFFFARIHDRWGSRNAFMWGVTSLLPAIASFPVINLLARHQGHSVAVWAAVGFQIIISVVVGLSYGSIFIFIAAASPNRASLGATNGLSQVMVSITRAIGPSLASSLFSLSMEHNYLRGYLVYYALIIVSIFALRVGSMLPRHIRT